MPSFCRLQYEKREKAWIYHVLEPWTLQSVRDKCPKLNKLYKLVFVCFFSVFILALVVHFCIYFFFLLKKKVYSIYELNNIVDQKYLVTCLVTSLQISVYIYIYNVRSLTYHR